MDLDGENPELRRFASHCAEHGGAAWVAEGVAGVVAAVPLEEDGAWEIKRLYVDRAQRGTGLAQALLETAEAHATAQGAVRLVLWSDTRFDAAHRFYERHGYRRSGGIRALGDRSRSLEFHYAKPAGIAEPE